MTASKTGFNRKYIGGFLSAVLLLVLFLASLCIGKYAISVKDIFHIFTGQNTDKMAGTVFFSLRLPRTVMVIMAGAGLSMAGSVFQTIFKNPLAAPDIIGVSSGANVGAAAAIIFLTAGTAEIAVAAFIGAITVVLAAVSLSAAVRVEGTVNLVLSGIVVGSFSQAVIMILKMFADPERQLAAIEFWSMGSFGNITGEKLLAVLPFFLFGLSGLVLFRWQINILSLSEDEGKALGSRVKLFRYIVLVFAALVVASIVCVSGIIMFIGLIAPHIARLITGKNSFDATVFSGITGAVLLLLADCFARIIASSEVPISIMTTIIGAPLLAYFMFRGSSRWNY